MVTFTCNNCGDSVKKNRVEKHSYTECRQKSGGPNLCCIDCLKDFREDYEAHTSCKTEDERYSAKGSFVGKEAKNKQLKKQMTWSEIIQSVAGQKNLSLTFKDILDIIKESDNVPRKDAKFKNFCKNNSHLRRFSEKDIMAVFNLLQEEMKKNIEATNLIKQQELAAAKDNKIEKPEAKKRSISEVSDDMEENIKAKKVKTSANEEVKEHVKDKKKKSKKTNDTDVDMNDKENGSTKSSSNGLQTVDDSIQNATEKIKKKKNKKKSQNASITDDVEATKTNGVQSNGIKETDEALTNGTSKKNKKKKNKNNSQSEGSNGMPEEDTPVDGELNDSTNTHKSPKKKRKSTEPEKTPFKEIIAKLLKPGTEFKLKSLKKMVFAVYKSGEEEVPREVRENFNKKLSKIPNVEINEKVVKMVK